MASSSSAEIGSLAAALAGLVSDVAAMGAGGDSTSASADCLRLARKVSLLSHLAEEIADFASKGCGAGQAESPPPSIEPASVPSSSSAAEAVSPSACLANLVLALEAAKRLLLLDRRPASDGAPADMVGKNVMVQFHYVTWLLEKVLGDLPYEYFDISDDVQEEVELVRAQLRRATEKCGTLNEEIFSEIHGILSCTHAEEVKWQPTSGSGILEFENLDHDDHDIGKIVLLVAAIYGNKCDTQKITATLMERLKNAEDTDPSKSGGANNESSNLTKKTQKIKRSNSVVIPDDFRCPISLELMRDPVIVSTGQTYERSFIQKWMNCGNRTCPKTQQKLQNLTLTPNYVLRSLIMQWCESHGVEQPRKSLNGWIRKSDGTFQEVSGDRDTIDALVRNLSSMSLDERRSAVAEIRSLAKRSTDNRILIAEAGAIPILVNLLLANDPKTQEHAVTAILNLSIYDHNKELIVLAGAVVPIAQVLRLGSMETRENAAAAIFSLSLIDDNKITIGSTPGVMEALVELLQTGSSRGKKDAATALFNLCIYQGNKARAIRAGILIPLRKMLQDPSSYGMVDEALTILSVLVSSQEAKAAIAKVNMIPLLIDLLRTAQPRNKENAAAILLALCKKNDENLACIGRLGALIPLTELAKSGTDRAKRKANSLLEHLSKLQML